MWWLKETTMAQNTNIQEALRMIDNHDWYWMMTDSGFESYRNAAKSHMKAFVKMVASIENASIREMLRSLWTLRWESARDSINGRKDEKNMAKQEELLNALTA